MRGACIDKIELINLMADGILPTEETDRLREHMSACDACQKQYDDIVAIKKAMSGLALEVPAGLEKSIMDAVRKEKKSRPVKRMIYRYATVAAACLAVVGMFFVFRAFNPGGMMKESAEVDDGNLAEQARKYGKDDNLNLEYTLAGSEDLETEAAAVAEITTDSKVMFDDSLTDYRYFTSAVDTPEVLTVNPDGVPLDAGFGGKQDIFYATSVYDISEILIILGNDYEVDMRGDIKSIFFYIDASRLKELEARLGLVAAGTVEDTDGEVSVRIISLKNEDE